MAATFACGLRVEGHACGSTSRTVQATVEEAIYEAAPDLTSLVVEGLEEPARFRVRCSRETAGIGAACRFAAAQLFNASFDSVAQQRRHGLRVRRGDCIDHDEDGTASGNIAGLRESSPVRAQAAAAGGTVRDVQRRVALGASAPDRTDAAQAALRLRRLRHAVQRPGRNEIQTRAPRRAAPG